MSRETCNRIITACAVGILSFVPAHAADVDGAWATKLGSCAKIFVKHNNRISMTKYSVIYGSGFIIEGDEIRGRKIRGNTAVCHIKTRKYHEDDDDGGPTAHFLAECSTNIAVLPDYELSFRINGDNTITRLYPGIFELGTTYHRCQL